tara:strand:+ start:2468 stop:2896 length:429 start_codon:yes stop_codon:yes gene_type:complete
MSKRENVKKIKKYIDEVLNTKSSLTAKRPLKQDKLRKLFCDALNELSFINARAVGMKHDFNVDFTEYDDPFFKVIGNLFKLYFTDKQRSMINWWLYDKFLPSGDILVLNDNDTHEEIPTETPEDIWNLLQELKKRDEKENSD